MNNNCGERSEPSVDWGRGLDSLSPPSFPTPSRLFARSRALFSLLSPNQTAFSQAMQNAAEHGLV